MVSSLMTKLGRKKRIERRSLSKQRLPIVVEKPQRRILSPEKSVVEFLKEVLMIHTFVY